MEREREKERHTQREAVMRGGRRSVATAHFLAAQGAFRGNLLTGACDARGS